MALPNSRLAEIMRRRKGGSNWDLGSQEAGLALSLAPFQSATDSYSDEYNQVIFHSNNFALIFV